APTPRTDAGPEEEPVGRERAETPRLVGVGRADDEAAAFRWERRDRGGHDALVERTSVDDQILHVAGAGIARARENERVAVVTRERRYRIEADVRRDRRGVGVERIEQRRRVRLRAVRH